MPHSIAGVVDINISTHISHRNIFLFENKNNYRYYTMTTMVAFKTYCDNYYNA